MSNRVPQVVRRAFVEAARAGEKGWQGVPTAAGEVARVAEVGETVDGVDVGGKK